MNSSPTIGCIVLAAGSSRRFGTDKRQALLDDGRRLLDATLQSIPELFAPRILVLRPDDSTLPATTTQGWRPIAAPEAALGMGHSLATGLQACADCAAVLVVLGDMPAVRPATYVALAEALQPDRIAVPRFAGRRGNPVGIGRDFFAELLQADGDRGARRLLQAHADAIQWVAVDDPGVLQDIDVPADLPGARSTPAT